MTLSDQVVRTAGPVVTTGADLLRPRLMRWIVSAGLFPGAIQVMALGALLSLAMMGWGVSGPSTVPDKLFAKSNLVTLAVWGLWWPVMVWVAVLLGRVWCMICPLEWVNSQARRLGRAIGIPAAAPPRWIGAGWLIVGLFALVQLLVPGIHLHRSPAYTSVMLSSLVLLAAVTGLLLRRRAFCQGFCPVGMLLACYGRGGAIAVRPRNGAAIDASERARLAANCPSQLDPARLSHSRDCVLCLGCVKQSPEMTLVARAPFASADERVAIAGWPVVVFAMLVSGFVTSEVCSESTLAKELYLWAPQRAASWLSMPGAAGWIEALWTLVAVPLALWTALGLIVASVGGSPALGAAWRRLAMPLLLVVAAGHMAKGIAKFVSWAGFLPLASSDPRGIELASALAAKRAAAPPALLSVTAAATVGFVVLAMALLYAVREARIADRARSAAVIAALVPLTALYLSVVVTWTGASAASALILGVGAAALVGVAGAVAFARKAASPAAG